MKINEVKNVYKRLVQFGSNKSPDNLYGEGLTLEARSVLRRKILPKGKKSATLNLDKLGEITKNLANLSDVEYCESFIQAEEGKILEFNSGKMAYKQVGTAAQGVPIYEFQANYFFRDLLTGRKQVDLKEFLKK